MSAPPPQPTAARRRNLEAGQAFVETLLMIWLLTLLLSAIIQVFLVHNYTFQMANNAYYSLFKDKAYGTYNNPDQEFTGFPNYRPVSKPLRTVKALQQAGGRVHVEAGGAINWSDDDRAAVPMMPFFKDAIVEQLGRGGITRAPVRLKIGSPVQGHNYLDMKFLRMAMGTEGGFGAFFEMIGSVISISGDLGSYTDYTEGDLSDMVGDYDNAGDELNNQDPDAAQKAREQWDEEHGDDNHDGYEDACELIQGNNSPDCKNDRPWE